MRRDCGNSRRHVIVENKAGGNTNIGSLYVAKAQPDGRTLLFAGTGITMNVAIYKDKMPFDPLKDFAPIALVSTSDSVLVANPGLNVANLNELIALLKSKPGALNYASAGSGNMTQLIMEFFKRKSGTDIVHVPYRGAGSALNECWPATPPRRSIPDRPKPTSRPAGCARSR